MKFLKLYFQAILWELHHKLQTIEMDLTDLQTDVTAVLDKLANAPTQVALDALKTENDALKAQSVTDQTAIDTLDAQLKAALAPEAVSYLLLGLVAAPDRCW